MVRPMKRRDADILYPHLTDERTERLESVLRQRTRDVVLVVNGIDKPHNYMALLRTAEAMGVQDVYIVLLPGQTPSFVSDAVTQGAHKWLTLRYYEMWAEARDELRTKGYRLIATYLSERSKDFGVLDLSGRIALVMGNELLGMSEQDAADCDECVVLPMHGFSQSYNVSVAAALCLQRIFLGREALGLGRSMPEEEALDLRDEWYRKAVKHSEAILQKARSGESHDG